MFSSKKKQLFVAPAKQSTSATTDTSNQSAFVSAALKKSAETLSGKGALKYATTGNPFIDQFGVLGMYKQPREFAAIEKDCETLWASNKLMTVVFILYLRMITRVVQLFNGVSTSVSQKGAELRHEGIMRMIWLSQKAPDTFWKNIGLFVSVGSWKDIITMLQYDLVYNGWEGRVLDWEKFGQLILSGLNNDKTVNLVKKYLPQIKAKSACKTVEAQADTIIGKWICSLLFGGKIDNGTGTTYKKYRKLKSSGTAHEWQQLISKGLHDLIDFDKIHGRALNLLVRSKYLKNHGLEDKYNAWITSPETKDVKYTGFAYELFSGLPMRLSEISVAQKETINKQFMTLITKGGEAEQTPLIVVRDTSGSMDSQCTGTNMSCYDVAKSLALYFSYFLKGKFQDAWIEFNSTAQMHTWKGETPLERWYNDHSNYIGSTQFQSVIALFCRMKNQGIPEQEFPKGILCISDGEFDPGQLSSNNVQNAKMMLKQAGFSEEYVANFIIVLWNLQSGYHGKTTGQKFETYGNQPGVYYFSGFSAAVASFLTGKVRNAEELFNAAMNQEILQMVQL